jgi:16S rRNA (guanine527-N7)-methyltransferase
MEAALNASTNDPWQALADLFSGLVTGAALEAMRQHASLVETLNARANLTAVTGPEAALRHYGESLELWRIASESAGVPDTVVDVGSGAGYPGMVFAIAAPDTRVVLVEPRQKRADGLRGMAATLGLRNVEVLAERAEDAGRGALRGSAELVTARAVAALPVLLEYTAPFARPGGWLAFPKGSGAEQEMAEAGEAASALGCGEPSIVPMRAAISETIRVVRYRQLTQAPDRYPRRAGLPAKRPLGERHRGDTGRRKT